VFDPPRLAAGLGWFSIGLGLAEAVVPKQLAKLIGAPERTGLIRAFGLRDIASGLGILTTLPRPVIPTWSRVVGDVLDLASLGVAFRSRRADSSRLAAATAAVVGVTVADLYCSLRLTRDAAAGRDGHAVRMAKSVAINRSPEEIYRFWRNFENLPRFMRHLESVQVTGPNRSHWVAKGPAGTTVEWDAEISDDEPNQLIAWRSVPGADVDDSGVVRFERAPGGRGTVVRVDMQYTPPAGVVGAALAKLSGEEPSLVFDDVRRLKQVMETGEIARSDGPSARVSDKVAARGK
jgi:uncharacterized membrane protein